MYLMIELLNLMFVVVINYNILKKYFVEVTVLMLSYELKSEFQTFNARSICSHRTNQIRFYGFLRLTKDFTSVIISISALINKLFKELAETICLSQFSPLVLIYHQAVHKLFLIRPGKYIIQEVKSFESS